MERLGAFIQDVDSVYEIRWNEKYTYRDVRFLEEQQFSVYNFEMAGVESLWKQFDLCEAEARRLLDENSARVPVLPAYDQVLKCSHLFNLLDARGAISVTERVGIILRIRTLAEKVAKAWIGPPQTGEAA
jgi:glycyl-tRNA synthetase alpha chain